MGYKGLPLYPAALHRNVGFSPTIGRNFNGTPTPSYLRKALILAILRKHEIMPL